MAYPLYFPEKAPKGTKQGAKLPEIPTQGREIGVFLAFSRVPCSITRIEQDLRRRSLYTTELLGHIIFASQDNAKKDLSEFSLGRHRLYPGELPRLTIFYGLYCIQPQMVCQPRCNMIGIFSFSVHKMVALGKEAAYARRKSHATFRGGYRRSDLRRGRELYQHKIGAAGHRLPASLKIPGF